MKNTRFRSTVLAGCILMLFSVNAVADNDYFEMTVTARSGLKLRDEPSMNGKPVGIVPYNETVRLVLLNEISKEITIDGQRGSWGQIKWKDTTGWAFTGFLKKVNKSNISMHSAIDILNLGRYSIGEKAEIRFPTTDICDITYKNGIAMLTSPCPPITTIVLHVSGVQKKIAPEQGYVMKLVIQIEKITEVFKRQHSGNPPERTVDIYARRISISSEFTAD